MNKFRPVSPDPFIVEDQDMTLARFGHINAIVDQLNAVVPSTSGLMYQSQYDPFGTGSVNDSRRLGNQLPAYYLNRANHTGTQSQATISGLVGDLSLKGDMFRAVYDSNLSGVVDNSERLGSQLPAYYLNRVNHTGSQAISTITGLQTALDDKLDDSQLGVDIATLVGGVIPLSQLPFSSSLYLGLYDASTNTPAIINGTGTAGEFYIANVTGNAYAPVNVTVINQVVAYNGSVWQVGAVFTGSISDVNGQTGPTVTLDLDDIPDTATRAAVTPAHAQALAGTAVPANASNPVATAADITVLSNAISNAGDMKKVTYDVNNTGIVDDSERLGNQLPVFYTSRTNHTGTQPQSTVANLITDLAAKIPFSEKGANSGVCELDVNGKVPASRLNISALNYQNSWNATTNIPFISNGIGTTGDTYIVGVGGTRNLGAGNITFNVGDLVVYNGSIWQKISAAVAGVTSINALTGVVTLNSDQVPQGSTNFYLTANQNSAVDNANSPGALNPFATTNDITPLASDISTLQSDVTTINGNLSLKENKSEKGVALGYCELDASGKVPNSRLNLSALNYQNSWNALTNTPALADGVGTAGSAYIVGTAGTQNLGSGAITFSVGDLVIYNGLVWQKITGVAPGVSSVNGFTGAVTLNADNIAETATRYYLTANQNAAVDGAVSASGANRFATLADVSGSDYFVTPQLYGATNSTSTFVSLGINQSTINATYPGTGAVTTDTVDWAALQYAINQSLATGKTLRTYGTYYVNKGLVVQPTQYEAEWTWEGNGATIQTTNNNAYTVITIGVPTAQESTPLVPTDAMWLVNNTYYVSRLKVRIGTNQTGFDFGPSYSSQYNQLLVFGNNGGVGIISKFNLNATFNNCNIRGCLYGFRLRSGNSLWTGATTSNSQCNHTIFQNCRVSWQSLVVPGEIGFDIVDASGIGVYDCIIEGTKVKKGINLSSQLTTVLTFSAKNVHYECTQGTAVAGSDEAFFYARTLGGLFTLDNIYGQYTAILADTGISSGGGSTTLKLSNTRFWIDKSGKAFNNAGNTNYISDFNDSIFFLSASWPGLVGGTPISLCGGLGCGNNKYSHYSIPR